MNIKEKIDLAKSYNLNYRQGSPLVSDLEYDNLLDEIYNEDPSNDFLKEIGFVIDDKERKMKLPIHMASMDKMKSIEEILNWIRLKQIPLNTELILTPKLDGVSLCLLEDDYSIAVSRGDGIYGQSCKSHYNLMSNRSNENLKSILNTDKKLYSYGEVIMLRDTFIDKWSKIFKNPRNLVAGQINTKEPSMVLSDCVYVRYGLEGSNLKLKSEILDTLNSIQDIKMPYLIRKISDITEDSLLSIFKNWSDIWEIDGIIVEVNDRDLCTKLGRETSTNNPCWARAYKSPSFEQSKETTYVGMTWGVSKQGLLKPVVHIKPIELDGVLVSNATCNNAAFVKHMGIGKGSVLRIVRSGMVIPLITNVIQKGEVELPTNCPCCGTKTEWNANRIELLCPNKDGCRDQLLKRIISFFEILEVDNVGEGVVEQLYNAGYDTIKKICSLSKTDLLKLDGFAKRKADIVYNNIHKKLDNVEKCVLQHSSGFFDGLGSKKLALVTKENMTFKELLSIDGFSDISANIYLNGIDKFNEFIKDLPVKIKQKEVIEVLNSNLEGMSFCFTGIRLKDAETKIISMGGKISSGVSKNTTHLVMKEKGTGTTKELKALELGITILTVEELERLIG